MGLGPISPKIMRKFWPVRKCNACLKAPLCVKKAKSAIMRAVSISKVDLETD